MCNLTWGRTEIPVSSVLQLLLCPNEENCHSSAKTWSYQKNKLGENKKSPTCHLTREGWRWRKKKWEKGSQCVRWKRSSDSHLLVFCEDKGPSPPTGRAFLHTRLSKLQKILNSPFKQGAKSSQSAGCYCLSCPHTSIWGQLPGLVYLSLFLGPTLVCLLASAPSASGAALPAAFTALAISACLSMQCFCGGWGVGLLFIVSCSFVSLFEELPGWSWKSFSLKEKPTKFLN